MPLLAVDRGQSPQPPVKKPGTVDRSFVVRRLQRNAVALINAHPKTELIGPDELVDNIAQSLGFESTDLVNLRIALGSKRYTLVCTPERIWHGRKKNLLDLKRLALWSGRTCILVPEGAIQRQPRLNTARTIEDATGVEVTLEQRMEVLLHLIERGTSTLFDCACAVSHPSPFSAILHLVALGVLKMATDTAMSPETVIELALP